MPLNFPDSPAINDTYVANGRTYVWDGTSWIGRTSGSAQITVSTTAPASPSVGDMWVDTN